MDLEALKTYIQGVLEETQFLVDVSFKPANGQQLLAIALDDDNGITVEKCAGVSRKVGNHIEENELFTEAYRLEVSSPDLNEPLKLIRQYKKNIGRDVKILTLESQEVEGTLQVVENDIITVMPTAKKGRKKKTDLPLEPITLNMSQINYTKLVIKF